MTKARLKDYRHLKVEVKSIKKQIEDLETDLYSMNAQKIGKVSNRGYKPGVTHKEIKIDEKDELLSFYRRKLFLLRKQLLMIEKVIYETPMDTKERTLLRLYYLQAKTWEEVCVEMKYSWSSVHRIHASALQKLQTK